MANGQPDKAPTTKAPPELLAVVVVAAAVSRPIPWTSIAKIKPDVRPEVHRWSAVPSIVRPIERFPLRHAPPPIVKIATSAAIRSFGNCCSDR
jgi:hypothetical protein